MAESIKMVRVFLLCTIVHVALGQQWSTDSLKKEILSLRSEVDAMQIDLFEGRKKFKQGLFIATLGYSITITGGLLLGENPDLGNALLITGGVTGVTGTGIMLNAFESLGKAYRRKQKFRNN